MDAATALATGMEPPAWDPVAHLLRLMEKDNEMLLTAYENTPPVKIECGTPPPPLQHQSESPLSPQPPSQNEPANYWPPSYDPTPVFSCGEDVVDEKVKKVNSVPVLLFASTYNLTASGSKRLNIGIEASVETEWRVVLELENAAKCMKVRFDEDSWRELYNAESYINNQMTEEYYEPRYNPPPPIECHDLTVCITTAYDDVALSLKTVENTNAIYLQHSTVVNLFGLWRAMQCILERLKLRLPHVKMMYREISEYLRAHNVHLDNLEDHMFRVPHEYKCDSTSVNEIRCEFIAYKKILFANLCKGDKIWSNCNDTQPTLPHCDYS